MNLVKLPDKKSTYQKQLHFYTLTVNSQKNKKKSPFKIASERIKYLRNFTSEVKDMYTEKYNILMTEIEDTNKWKDVLVIGQGGINNKMSMLPKTIDSVQFLSELWHFSQN